MGPLHHSVNSIHIHFKALRIQVYIVKWELHVGWSVLGLSEGVASPKEIGRAEDRPRLLVKITDYKINFAVSVKTNQVSWATYWKIYTLTNMLPFNSGRLPYA